MCFDWVTAILTVTIILTYVSLISSMYSWLEWRDTRLTIIWGGLFLACVFVLGGMLR